MKIAIVADDLTGALDAAVPFADLGMGTSVALTTDAGAALADGGTPVVSVDTDSRDASPEAAAEAVFQAMSRLVGKDRRLPFKKIDSTLRGHIGVEAVAALLGSGRHTAILSPAAPRLGRQLRNGRLVVHGEDVGADDFVRTLGAQVPGVSVHRLLPGEAVEAGSGQMRLFVADAQEESHLDFLVDLGLARPAEILLVGSSGLSAALARRVGSAGQGIQARPTGPFRRILYVVGSRNPRSIAQVRELLATGDVADLGLPVVDGTLALPAVTPALKRVGVVYVKGLEAAEGLDPRRTAEQLAEVAVSILAGDAVEDLLTVMTGGDTARATLERLGLRVVEVRRSLAPGVVFSAADLGGRPVSLVTKAGGFGDPRLFERLASELLDAG